MRIHGRANISQVSPRALAVCQRCGFLYNHTDLSWQFQWRGTKLQNTQLLVCQPCLDTPQEQLRVIILPPDPIPISNARPEDYVNADNAMSAVGYSPNQTRQTFGSRIGNLLGGGGLNSAFDGNAAKPSWQSACNSISNSSYNNYVGINWSGVNAGALSAPSSLLPPVVRHSLASFTITAPTDRSFLGTTATSYVVQSSPVDVPVYGAWTTISSGTTTGEAGEVLTGECVTGLDQFHRVAFQGDGLNYISVAQVEFNVAQVGNIATGGSS